MQGIILQRLEMRLRRIAADFAISCGSERRVATPTFATLGGKIAVRTQIVPACRESIPVIQRLGVIEQATHDLRANEGESFVD